MTVKTKRYVAEIDLPDGFISIDCEVKRAEKYIISLQLNHITLSYKDSELTPFKEELVNNNEVVIEYRSGDFLVFLNNLFKKEFQGYTDISITEVDTD